MGEGPDGPWGLAQANTPPEARSRRAPHTGRKQVHRGGQRASEGQHQALAVTVAEMAPFNRVLKGRDTISLLGPDSRLA